MKTLAQLKRDAKSGNLYAEMIYRWGTKIPENLQGKRRIIDSNSVGIKFLNQNGSTSDLSIKNANLVEYDEYFITIYDPGERDLNEDEKTIFSKWETMRNKKQEEMDCLTDTNVTYWRRKHFFIDAGYEYLLGYDKKQGKIYINHNNKIRDDKIKGDMIIQYKIVVE